jgi:hypothetical protein
LTRRSAIYWSAQLLGWSLYVLVAAIWNFFINDLNAGVIKVLITSFILGITLSNLYRLYIIRQKWVLLPVTSLIPRVLAATIILGLIFALLQAVIYDTFFDDIKPLMVFPYEGVLTLATNWIIIFLLWSALYFAGNYLRNYRSEEIKNLRHEALRNEVELNNLKAQLNPHFMFNSMNSIRALVDDEPQHAKDAITKLASLLRTTLLTGKQKLIPLNEELKLVKDYLALEKIRYEERLITEFNIDPQAYSYKVPPLMLLTLVENAIKHGITHLPKGGLVKIDIDEQKNYLEIIVLNSGKYNPGISSGTGIGLKNTTKRLELLYGNRSEFNIENLLINNSPFVKTRVILPLNSKFLSKNKKDASISH